MSSNIFTIAFATGMSGTFLMHLISMHKGFHSSYYRPDKRISKDDPYQFKGNHIYCPDVPEVYNKQDMLNIPKYKKYICKHLPDHSFRFFKDNKDQYKDFVNLIVLHGKNVSRQRNVHAQLNITDIEIFKTYSNVVFVDIEKILQCNEDEYTKLCNFIQSPKLDNFKQMVKDYKKVYID